MKSSAAVALLALAIAQPCLAQSFRSKAQVPGSRSEAGFPGEISLGHIGGGLKIAGVLALGEGRCTLIA
jgi:hypothetical protein